MRDEQFDRYSLSGNDDAGEIKYRGYLSISAAWYIIEEHGTNKTFKYAKGTKDFGTNWTNRASLDYRFYNEVFVG